MTEHKLIHLIKSDLHRYFDTYRLRGDRPNKFKIYLESFIFKAGFLAVFLYRISHWLWRHKLNIFAWSITRISVTLTGAEIEYNMVAGPGLLIPHPVGIVIGRGSKIGSRVTIYHNVTLGVKSWSKDTFNEYPNVGNNVIIFAGAKVLGSIKLGDNCVVGANSVVLHDVPEGAQVFGVPAKIISSSKNLRMNI